MSLHLERERFLPSGLDTKLVADPGNGFWGSIYTALWERFGDPYWWPGRDAWEVAAGEVLTQNTAWTNVEQALVGLRERGWITADAIRLTDQDELAPVIRPAGYFNQKARKLKELAEWWGNRVESGAVESLGDDELRDELLALWGVGPETADAIACYALGRPLFVVDTYTQRMLARLRGLEERPSYDSIQSEVDEELPRDPMLLNHLHGLIVVLSKEHCTARNPQCGDCPLQARCVVGSQV
ncbi:hypothetical protein KQI63_16690 [bacterium]|nr:hypothetical protein [bacterium]